MSIFRNITVLLIVAMLSACAGMGGMSKSEGQVSVKIGPPVINDAAKVKRLRGARTVESLHQYVSTMFKKNKINKSITADIKITKYRGRSSNFSGMVDQLAVNVKLKKNGRVKKKFNSMITTRGMGTAAARKMAKGMAKRIVKQAQAI